MAASLSISGAAFDKWKVQPVARIGREAFFTVADVVENRVSHKLEQAESKNQISAQDDDDELNPLRERVLLDREKRIGQELSNDKEKGNLFPISAGSFVMARVGAEMSAVLDSLTSKIKRVMPKMTATQMNEVRKEIAKAKNSCADIPGRLDEFIEEHYASTEK